MSSSVGLLPGFDPNAYRGCNVIERCFNQLEQWRGLAARVGQDD